MHARIGELTREAMELFTAAVEQTPPAQWDRPSNLEGWSVRELVAHATGSAAKIVTLVEDGQLWARSEPADWSCEDPAARLRELTVRLRALLPDVDPEALRVSPEGAAPLHRALAFPVSDLALHSWDLHRCAGRLIQLPEQLLAFCRDLVSSLPEDLLRRPGGFGPAQPAPADAGPTARLLAYLGRSVEEATGTQRSASGSGS